MIRGMCKIRDLVSDLNMPKSVLEEAQVILKKVEETQKLKGKGLIVKCAAIIYFALRRQNLPKNFKGIRRMLSHKLLLDGCQ